MVQAIIVGVLCGILIRLAIRFAFGRLIRQAVRTTYLQWTFDRLVKRAIKRARRLDPNTYPVFFFDTWRGHEYLIVEWNGVKLFAYAFFNDPGDNMALATMFEFRNRYALPPFAFKS